MKKKIHHIAPIAWLFVLIVVVTGCTQLSLEEPPTTGNVTLAFDWKNLSAGEKIPVGMKLHFYGSKGNVIIMKSTGLGFNGALPVDTYKVIAYNTDAQGVAFRDTETYVGAKVYAKTVSKGHNYVSHPKHVYGIGLGSIIISRNGTAASTVAPVNFVKTATATMTVKGNKSVITSCSSTLEGLSQTVSIADGTLYSDGSVIQFTAQPTTKGFESTFSFFGKSADLKSNLSTTFTFAAGGESTVVADITSSLTGTIPAELGVNVNVDVKNSIQLGNYAATLIDWNYYDRTGTIQ